MNFGKDDHVMLNEMKDEDLNGEEAVVTEVFEKEGNVRYGLYIKDFGEFAWATADQMELIERNRADLIEEWKEEEDSEEEDSE